MADRLNPSGELRWFLVKSQPWKAKQVVSHVECEHKILSIGQSLTWRTGLILRENYGYFQKKSSPEKLSQVVSQGRKPLACAHKILFMGPSPDMANRLNPSGELRNFL